MAGITDITTQQPADMPVQQAQDTISMLDEARNQARGIQKSTLKDLFSYDKALSERYSSPESKMYLENAGDREDAISGYSDTARKQVNNIFDIMETVRSASDDLKALLEKNKSGSGSGSGDAFSLSDINTWLNTQNTPDPPADMMDKYNKGEGVLFYKVLPDKTVDWQFKAPYEPVEPEYEVWRPSPNKDTILQETFGLDRAKLAELSAISAMFGEKKANSLLWSYVQSGFTNTNRNEVDTTAEAVAQIKSYKTREDARADLEKQKSFLQSKGVDTDRIDREIDIYFDKQEESGSSFESTQSFLETLKKQKGE